MSQFRYAPPSTTVDGLFAVSIQVEAVNGTITFDAAARAASATAEMQFTVGPDSGYPIFDLRQEIASATLDGVAVPPSDMAHHDFGGGANAELRVLERWLAARSAHLLALSYPVGTPDAPNARGVVWESGSSRLSFDFFLSDLNPSRYLESWLPSNLLFDQFPVTLEVALTGALAHVLISNGTVTDLDFNHWSVAFPAAFAPCSHFLVIEAADRIEQHTGSAVLPGGQTVSIELAQRAGDGLNLAAAEATVAGYLAANHSGIGPYMHGDRFVALLTGGPYHNMEYDGATTTTLGALAHEVYHSWWARGLVPAQGQDGWLDEAWTTYNTGAGGPDAVPLDMTDPPVTMWPSNPWRRNTPNSAYGHGADVFSGIAADIGIGAMRGHMSGIFKDATGRHYTTPEVEAEFIRRSGHMPIADYFDRFVYGGASGAPFAANLHLRDATDDTGTEPYTGNFWLSPDVWVRNAEDGGTVPQDPELGQDNWLYARVSNRGNATVRSFVVGFKLQIWAGTQFVFPGDWFPLTGVAVGFDLAPGQSRIVHTCWPATDIPPQGSHGCLLAMAWCVDDRPAAGRHVWEEDTLAQRNLTVVDLQPNEWEHLPFRIGSRYARHAAFNLLELVRPQEWPDLEVRITHRRPERVKALYRSAELLKAKLPVGPSSVRTEIRDIGTIRLARGFAALTPAAGSALLIGAVPHGLRFAPGAVGARLAEEDRGGLAIRFDPGPRAALPIGLDAGEAAGFELCVRAPKGMPRGGDTQMDLMQRDEVGHVVGGFSLRLRRRDQKEKRS